MEEVLRVLNLTLTSYSLAPCWDDATPYYGLFVERGDLMNGHQGQELAAALDRRLATHNVEYASKRDSQRLGAVRINLLPDGTWQEWDRQRQTRSGGTPEQYKHPNLIPDISFRNTMPVEEELLGADAVKNLGQLSEIPAHME
jgi:hypothetical protein